MLTIQGSSCSQFGSTYNAQTMSKRLIQQERSGNDERVVAKSKPIWSLVSKTVDRSPIALGSSASHSPETLKAHSSNSDRTGTGRHVARGLKESPASSSQELHFDATTNTSTERPVAETTKKPIGTQLSHHDFEISRINGHPEKVFSDVRRKLSPQLGDDVPEIDVKATIWVFCQRLWKRQLSATTEAAVIAEKIYKTICVQPRIRTSKRSSSCPIFQRN